MRNRDAARAFEPDYPEVGERLRARRRVRGLSLRVLAERLGVSPSLISQIERGRARPSVSTLFAIVTELDASLDELLFNDERPSALAARSGPEERPSPVQEAGTRRHIRLASGVVWERLTTTSQPGVEFLFVVYDVGGASSPGDTYQSHSGYEWGYVISGVLEVVIGFDRYVLQPGDAVSLDSSVPHRLANIGDTPVHAIWFVLGRDADPRLIGRLSST
ncbi:MAG: helix-turn-helix domain-containing protein [Candidatus Limnocylindria bacterium]